LRKDRNTGKVYKSYWDWLRHGRLIWLPVFFFAYGWYLGSTEEVKSLLPKKKNAPFLGGALLNYIS
jgi:hypothetical protein